MAVPQNGLQNVQTYQKTELAYLLNTFGIISNANKKYKDFNDLTANLGDTVTFDAPARYIGYNGLVVTMQPSVQQVVSLICSQAYNISSSFTDQQFIFNARSYMDRFDEAAIKELGSAIESDVAKNFVSGVVANDPQGSTYGQVQSSSGPYRFYYAGLSGATLSPINSFTQLAQAVANYDDYGSAKNKRMGFIPVVSVPQIIGSGLTQFATDRNNQIDNYWELGDFSDAMWIKSNLLPVHYAGTVGNTGSGGNVLTIVSVNDPSGTNVTQITFSGATPNDANAIKVGDLFEFNDGVMNQPNLRFLQYIGHQVCQQKVQFVAIANAGADGSGNVVVSLRAGGAGQGLTWVQNQNQNINYALAAGMQVTVMPSHRAGCFMSGDQFYLAMPALPDQNPYQTVTTVDKDSGCSIRHYWGSQGFGLNALAYVRDVIWGSTLYAPNSQRLLFPL